MPSTGCSWSSAFIACIATVRPMPLAIRPSSPVRPLAFARTVPSLPHQRKRTSRTPSSSTRSTTSCVMRPARSDSEPPRTRSSSLAPLEQLLPPREQRLQLLARTALCLQRLDVGPVVRELALELGERLLAHGDLRLELLELARPLRLSPRFRRRLRLAGFGLRLRRRARSLVASPDVVRPAAVVATDGSILERERPLRDRVDQRAVVRHEQDRAGERLERRLECLARLEIQVVRRLVEHEEVRTARDDVRECEASAFSARQHRDRLLVLVPSGEEEAAEQRLRLWAREIGGALRRLEHRVTLVELDLLLREVADVDAVAEVRAPAVFVSPAEQRLEERRLARAVRADKRDVLTALEREGRVVEQLALADSHAELLRLDDRSPASWWIDEAEAESLRAPREQRDLVADLRLLLCEPADLRQFGLRLLRLRFLVAEACDEALEPGDVLCIARCLLRGDLQARRLLEPPPVPGAGEVRGAAGLELEHGSRRCLEKPAVVRDEHDARVERLQLVLKPLEARDVEVVRRLVKEQEVGIPSKCACERRAGELAAGERVEYAVEVTLAETEPARHGAEPLPPCVTAGMLEARLGLRVAAKYLGAVVAGLHRLLEPP